MQDWNSQQYLLFAQERTQPAIDLANRIPLAAAERIVDIGSGPGNSTEVVARRFPGAAVLGIDSSPAMVEAAGSAYPQFYFQTMDAGADLTELGSDYDVAFSNACIQWIPDHPRVIRSWLNLLRPGGVLAVQTPMNYDEPIHQIIGELTTSPRWQAHFPEPRIFYNLQPDAYYDLLAESASDFALWSTTYYHKMKSHQAILEWYRSTGLRPYLAALSDDLRPVFKAEVMAQVIQRYPPQRNGEIIFRFPRFFFLAIR